MPEKDNPRNRGATAPRPFHGATADPAPSAGRETLHPYGSFGDLAGADHRHPTSSTSRQRLEHCRSTALQRKSAIQVAIPYAPASVKSAAKAKQWSRPSQQRSPHNQRSVSSAGFLHH